jgi:hypothetical protein
LARALTDRGYEVRTAADGQAAITILEGSGTLPAITITDLQMTGGSGEELARPLRRRYPDLPLIFMTAIWHVTGPPISPGPSWRSRSAPTKLCELIRSVLTAASELRAYGKNTAGQPGPAPTGVPCRPGVCGGQGEPRRVTRMAAPREPETKVSQLGRRGAAQARAAWHDFYLSRNFAPSLFL